MTPARKRLLALAGRASGLPRRRNPRANPEARQGSRASPDVSRPVRRSQPSEGPRGPRRVSIFGGGGRFSGPHFSCLGCHPRLPGHGRLTGTAVTILLTRQCRDRLKKATFLQAQLQHSGTCHRKRPPPYAGSLACVPSRNILRWHSTALLRPELVERSGGWKSARRLGHRCPQVVG